MTANLTKRAEPNLAAGSAAQDGSLLSCGSAILGAELGDYRRSPRSVTFRGRANLFKSDEGFCPASAHVGNDDTI
jgi:hypothetical protein